MNCMQVDMLIFPIIKTNNWRVKSKMITLECACQMQLSWNFNDCQWACFDYFFFLSRNFLFRPDLRSNSLRRDIREQLKRAIKARSPFVFLPCVSFASQFSKRAAKCSKWFQLRVHALSCCVFVSCCWFFTLEYLRFNQQCVKLEKYTRKRLRCDQAV